MTKTNQFRQFAAECLRWAAEATTQQDKKPFLDMANDWAQAAIRLEGKALPEKVNSAKEKLPHEAGGTQTS
jgi:hypothetical protein